MVTIFDRMTALAACLCEQIREDGLPPTCFCGVIPGDAAVADYAGNCSTACGMAWVRLSSLMPMEGVGRISEEPGNCGKELGGVVEVGIIRCIGTSTTPPNEQEYLGSTELQMADMMAMYRAIVCCDAFSNKDYILGTYVPTGPLGGLVGGTWQMTVI